MTRRIFRSIVLVALVAVLACLALILGTLYNHFMQRNNTELRTEAAFIAQGLKLSGSAYFDGMPAINSDNRVTWIAQDGTVLYDSAVDAQSLDNHGDREEVIEAQRTGVGESMRYSATMAEKTFYFAQRLEDGTVIRVSDTRYTIWVLLLGLLQPLILILVLTVILSAVLASRSAKRIVGKINEIDPDNPEAADTYDELTPLLRRLAVQKSRIRTQLEELQSQQQAFQTITENMQEGLLVIDEHTDLLSYNKGALKLLGVREAPEGESVLTLNRGPQFRQAIYQALGGQHDEQTLPLGGRRLRLIANPVRREDALVGAVLFILDVTEAEAREQLRREFSANVSHELKTPLTSISGFAEIIKDGIARPEDVPRMTQKIYDEAQRLITLVEDIVRLSQLDEDSVPIETEAVDLAAVTEEAVERLRPLAAKNQVSFTLKLAPAVIANGAKQILEEMVYNLCDNAIKYNKEGGQVTVTLSVEPEGPKLQVADTGIGIPYDEQDRVFERFYRVDKSHSKEIGGTGLGLSIVKHGAAYHNAAVKLESVPGQGTVVTLQFPPQ